MRPYGVKERRQRNTCKNGYISATILTRLSLWWRTIETPQEDGLLIPAREKKRIHEPQEKYGVNGLKPIKAVFMHIMRGSRQQWSDPIGTAETLFSYNSIHEDICIVFSVGGVTIGLELDPRSGALSPFWVSGEDGSRVESTLNAHGLHSVAVQLWPVKELATMRRRPTSQAKPTN